MLVVLNREAAAVYLVYTLTPNTLTKQLKLMTTCTCLLFVCVIRYLSPNDNPTALTCRGQ